MRLHHVHLIQLVVQYAYLYGTHWADYDVLVLALAAVSVSRHLLLRSLYDTFSARRQLRRHAASYPYSSVLLFIIFIAIPLVVTARLFSLRRYTSVVLCLLPSFYSMLLFPRLLAPIPPDLLYLSYGTKGVNASSSSGKPARPRLTAYLLRYGLQGMNWKHCSKPCGVMQHVRLVLDGELLQGYIRYPCVQHYHSLYRASCLYLPSAGI